MVSRSFIILVLATFLVIIVDVHADRQTTDRRKLKEPLGLTREQIINNHKRRRVQLEKLIEDTRKQVDDHKSRRKLMESEEYEKITKRLGLYEQKLLRMSAEPDEKDIRRMMDREKMRAERNSRREL